ncbi:HNH endonuclease [Moritella yayanosii]|uniref:HNH endonuclease n=1 Tax=Moritella yayanosii TaxID=69539 RepID=A0A330LPM3_9GAMM|nr:HNH endonuclease signature motif containing protein [Moritella yayanosii]SQD77951.1 HNH endonuclease [Moritella yayanosii]
MAKDTPSIAKNKIKRSLSAILDPHPSTKEVTMLWAYFENSCVYCDLKMERKSRIGHLDHVVAQADGGNNSISNYVLSCAKCNGDEKREMDWLLFLNQKSDNADILATRKLKIENWLKKNTNVNFEATDIEEAEKIIAVALAQFDESVKAMRSLRVKIT